MELLESVTRSVLVGQDHLHIPPATLIEMLPRLDPTQPVSYVGFSFDHRHLPKLAGVEAQPFSVQTSSGPWLDLNLSVVTRGDETKALLKYSQQSFRRRIIETMLNDYIKCVELLVSGASNISEITDQLTQHISLLRQDAVEEATLQ
jgi:hypothetical protein